MPEEHVLENEPDVTRNEPDVAENEPDTTENDTGLSLDTEEQIVESLQLFHTTAEIGSDSVPSSDDDQMSILLTQGCRCTLSMGMSCNSQFTDEYLQSHCLNCMEMT